jgi:hypothetical protein
MRGTRHKTGKRNAHETSSTEDKTLPPRFEAMVPACSRRRFLREGFPPSGVKIVHGNLLFFICLFYGLWITDAIIPNGNDIHPRNSK